MSRNIEGSLNKPKVSPQDHHPNDEEALEKEKHQFVNRYIFVKDFQYHG